MSTRIFLILTVAVAVTAACAQSEPQQAAPSTASAAAEPAPAPPAATPVVATPEPTAPAVAPATATPASAAPPPAGAAAASASPAPAPAKVAPAAAPPAAEVAPTPVAAAPPKPAPPPPPPEPPKPVYREVTVPAGTEMSVKVLSTLASNASKVEDIVKGSLAKSVVISGRTALREGTQITGSVIDAKESGRVKGKASLVLRFDRMVVDEEMHRIHTAAVSFEAEDKKSDDVKKGGLGAGLGAAIGGIAGGGKGAAIGAIAGGTGAVLTTKGREVEIVPGTVVTVLLQEPLTIRTLVK